VRRYSSAKNIFSLEVLYMPIDLEQALRRDKLQNSSGIQFKFESPGDQIVFKFLGMRAVVSKNNNNEQAHIVDCEILAGEKVTSGKVERVTPARRAFFYLKTDSKRILDAESPVPGDVFLIRLSMIRKDLRNMREFSYEILERAEKSNGAHVKKAW
jgi:hypothetical protein